MSIYHDEVEIEDMEYDDDTDMYYYPCPCGDKFQISKVFLIWMHCRWLASQKCVAKWLRFR